MLKELLKEPPFFIFKIILGFIAIIALGAAVFVLWLTLNEYKPEDIEAVLVSKNASQLISRNRTVELYSWNIGYASLDASQDFFMDGGQGIRPSTDRNVEENIWAIQAYLSVNKADIILFQEVDTNSHRSYGVDEADYFSGTWKGSSAFAYNFRSKFIPYPSPHFIGRVNSGLLTLNSFAVSGSERIALPSTFTWPERIVQLKRCFLVERLPVEESEAQLVLVNLHLDAYDSGEGRAAQTKNLAEFLAAEYEKGNYCIAAGDFNQSFPGTDDVFPLMEKDNFIPSKLDTSLLGEDWTFAADINVPSNRLLDKPYTDKANHQFYVLDGFILSPHVETVLVQAIDLDFKNSDHNPVRLTFSLK
jgi:endonuclease/exonuclease/phosphatase family metal-dependent hydrolase